MSFVLHPYFVLDFICYREIYEIFVLHRIGTYDKHGLFIDHLQKKKCFVRFRRQIPAMPEVKVLVLKMLHFFAPKLENDHV